MTGTTELRLLILLLFDDLSPRFILSDCIPFDLITRYAEHGFCR